MAEQKVPITVKGLKKLQDEIVRFRTVERPAIIAAIEEARAHGDLSENAEYHAAKEKQSFIEGRIEELEDIASRVQVIDHMDFDSDKVVFGATVVLLDVEADKEKTYQVVGQYEADIDEGLISTASPLGRALIGKEVGEEIEIATPNGTKAYELLEIKYI